MIPEVTLQHLLTFGAILFALGVYAVVVRRSLAGIRAGAGLMVCGGIVCLAAFAVHTSDMATSLLAVAVVLAVALGWFAFSALRLNGEETAHVDSMNSLRD